MARRPSGDVEICSLLNALLSCFVHTPCPAWGCGRPHAGATPHRGRVGGTEGTPAVRWQRGVIPLVSGGGLRRPSEPRPSHSVCVGRGHKCTGASLPPCPQEGLHKYVLCEPGSFFSIEF